MSIGALSLATGIPIETLRTWELRYGFPTPERKPSGHRVYPVSSVPRLRRIADAIARGLRAGEAVPASEAWLDQVLGTGGQRAAGVARSMREPATPIADLLNAAQEFDSLRLTSMLHAEWGRLGPLEFLRTRVAPLIHAAGEAWESGELEICQEHFLSERIGDLLRSLRLPFEDRATGPVMVLATLPGEAHGIGLLMAALILAANGHRLLYLGTQVPPPQIVDLAHDVNAVAVGISLSQANAGSAMNQQLRRLRRALPATIEIVAGGDGAPRSMAGIEIIRDLNALDQWANRGLRRR